MRSIRRAAAVLCCLSLPGAAGADAWQPLERPSYPMRVTAKIRSGYAWGLGDLDEGTKMSDAVGHQFPVQLDVGLRLLPELSVGVYGSYGFSRPTGLTADFCDGFGATCTAHALRGGLQLIRHFTGSSSGGAEPLWNDPRREGALSSWVGVGVGYDAIAVTMKGPGGSADVGANGIEATAQGGIDVHASGSSALGLFASVSVARYLNLTSGGQSQSVTGRPLHHWVTLGVYYEYGR